MSFDDKDSKAVVDDIMKLISQRAADLGLEPDMFKEDKQLIEDLFADIKEIEGLAGSVHHKLMNSASHAIEDMLKGRKGGTEELQQLIIMYYRLRDQFIAHLFEIENDFYKFVVGKIMIPREIDKLNSTSEAESEEKNKKI